MYFDKNVIESCFDICNSLKIDNLPSIDGVNYYELNNGQFKKWKITKNKMLNLDQPIFNNKLLQQFSRNKHNVLFVFDADIMCGVVHLADYNRDIVLQSIQDDLLTFERKLRQLIILNGLGNDNMRQYFIYRRDNATGSSIDYFENKIRSYDFRIEELNSLAPFQLFDFRDLLEFANSSFAGPIFKMGTFLTGGKKKQVIAILRDLRNLAMHGKNPVSKNKESSIFSIESLQTLMESLQVLRLEFTKIAHKIRHHPDHLKSIELENRSKLEIIHNHHPRALEYFLEFT